jgi:hypothetical protein
MTKQRTIIFIVAVLAAFAGVSSGSALASSLLSGYGGPGQGNQAILGSALLNGPSGGGGGSGASVSSTSAGEVGSAASSGSGGSHATGGPARGSHKPSSGAPARGSQVSGAGTHASEASSVAAAYAAAEKGGPAPSSGTLGLSGADFLLIVLALGTLVFMGVLTRRVARTSAPGSQR